MLSGWFLFVHASSSNKCGVTFLHLQMWRLLSTQNCSVEETFSIQTLRELNIIACVDSRKNQNSKLFKKVHERRQDRREPLLR